MVSRHGFTLVEVLVAAMVLSVVALGVAATSTVAARMMSRAEAREGAVVAAATVLDSLLREPRPAAGSRTVGRYRVRWTVGAAAPGSLVELTVEYDDGGEVGRLTFRGRALPPPPRLGATP